MTLVPMRKTSAGQEYWDKELKKVVFYPTGQSPDDETIHTEGMVGQYAANGEVAKSIEVKLHLGEKIDSIEQQELSDKDIQEPTIDEMDIDGLRAYAEENSIDIPGNMKKLETIRQHIIEELNAVADSE